MINNRLTRDLGIDTVKTIAAESESLDSGFTTWASSCFGEVKP